MSLTIEQQRKLTEFLGECWHEPARTSEAIEHIHFGGSPRCGKCGERLDLNLPFNKHGNRLDLTDWRVVGRLISSVKERGKTITMRQYSYGRCYVWFADDEGDAIEAPSLEEAICLAVLAYLETP